MGRNKNNKQHASLPDNNNFENPVSMNVDDEIIEDVAATSNLTDDRTSADYYFDSYSHFGINLSFFYSKFSSFCSIWSFCVL